jgi:phage recombination protein Bet
MAEVPSTELATQEAGLDRLGRRPIIDRVDARTLSLIKAQVAKNCTDAEVGYFLELAAHYDLDPFAREIWCAKDDKLNARVLIMVGRDGLRKIAQRQGFGIDGDVVREKDEFRVQRTEHGRVIHHAYGMPAERGNIVGAWCQVTTIDGREHGYFFALLSEYRPSNVSQYSPWSKQTSVMILAAAERQALRQATPLSGLLAEGEDESAAAISTGHGDGSEPGWGGTSEESAAAVERIIERAQALGHAGLSDRATAQMTLSGQPESVVAMWIARARTELDEFEARQSEAEPATPTTMPPPGERFTTSSTAVVAPDPEALRDELGQVLDRIAAEEEAGADETVLGPLYAEQERLEGLLGDGPSDDGQETMPL